MLRNSSRQPTNLSNLEFVFASIPMTLDIFKAYASAPKGFDAFWNDGCCAFVKPSGKCGQPADAKACLVDLSFGDTDYGFGDAHVALAPEYFAKRFGNIRWIRQCGYEAQQKLAHE